MTWADEIDTRHSLIPRDAKFDSDKFWKEWKRDWRRRWGIRGHWACLVWTIASVVVGVWAFAKNASVRSGDESGLLILLTLACFYMVFGSLFLGTYLWEKYYPSEHDVISHITTTNDPIAGGNWEGNL